MAQIIPSTEMPAEKYHAHPSLSCSLIKLLSSKQTPVDFWRASWMNPHREDEQNDSIAKKFGRAAHMLLLEGQDVFDTHWTVKKGVGSTKEDGKLGEEEMDTLKGIRDALLGDTLAGAIIPGCQSEVSMFAEVDLEVGGNQVKIPARCRHDLWKPQYSADLKFMDEVTEESVAKAIANYGYDIQAHWYPRIMAKCQPQLEHQNFITIFVEKRKRNPKVLCVTYHDSVLTTVRLRVDERLKRFYTLLQTHGEKEWPGFQSRIYNVFTPGSGDGMGLELPRYWDYMD